MRRASSDSHQIVLVEISLIKISNPRKGKENSLTTSETRKNIQRLEREMATIQNETNRIEEIYGANTLKFVIAKSYIKKLLDNNKVLHWLIEHNPDYLKELKKYHP
ncbi:plasmid partitioning protein RepB C-terminal domain-containing protein [Dickeya chrysanthemi]|uniref:Plasmid partitioning protein RepB C-terminal domain-containing protein n=1 Tax=Dickeya chrysanthemi TaxID=556 RepID=A0ABU8JRL4_DICCH